MYVGHPYDCKERAYPTTCNICGQLVIYWECYHGSKVFFDPNYAGQHACGYRTDKGRADPSPPRRSGKEYWETLIGVTESIEPKNYGLIHGMVRYPKEVADYLERRRKGVSEAQQRDTVAMHPYAGSREDNLIGEIAGIIDVYLPERFDFSESSVLAATLVNIFPGFEVKQLTILVDDFLNDPAAVDLMSYTVWCPAGMILNDVERGQSVEATFSAKDMLIVETRWVAESIELLGDNS